MCFNKRLVRRSTTAAHPQLQLLNPVPLAQQQIGIDQQIQTFFPTHPRKKTEHGIGGIGRAEFCAPRTRITFQIDPVVNDPHAIRAQTESAAHQIAVVAAGSHEQVHFGRPFSDRFPAQLAIAIRQGVEKCVFSLEHADNRHAQVGFESPHQPDQERVG